MSIATPILQMSEAYHEARISHLTGDDLIVVKLTADDGFFVYTFTFNPTTSNKDGSLGYSECVGGDTWKSFKPGNNQVLYHYENNCIIRKIPTGFEGESMHDSLIKHQHHDINTLIALFK